MIYLIGGSPRVGKTTLAQMLLARKNIPFIPVDILADTLSKTYPELGINFGGFSTWEKIPEMFFPYLKPILQGMKYYTPEYTFEGDSFFPKQAKEIMDANIKCCFLGASSISLENIKKFAYHDWVSAMPEELQQGLPAWIVEKSSMIKDECEKYSIQYFDVAVDRKETLEAAYDYLISA